MCRQTDRKDIAMGELTDIFYAFVCRPPAHKPVISTIKIKTFDVTFRYFKKITFHIIKSLFIQGGLFLGMKISSILNTHTAPQNIMYTITVLKRVHHLYVTFFLTILTISLRFGFK